MQPFSICINDLFPSRSDWKRWLFSQMLFLHIPLNIRDSNKTDLQQHVFVPCWCNVMNWAQATYYKFILLTCALWCHLKKPRNLIGKPPDYMDVSIMKCCLSCVLGCVLILVECDGLSVSAEICYHLLTQAKTLLYLKPPTMVLQKIESCRRRPLPGYTTTHTTLNHHVLKKIHNMHILRGMSAFFRESALVV